jgi:hypothetical protein
MTQYEAGFDAGERDSFSDRRTGARKQMPEKVRGHYQRGYWDGYCPGNSSWLFRKNTPSSQRLIADEATT